MSGKPNSDKVLVFRLTLARTANASERIGILTEEIRTCQIELENQRKEYTDARDLMFKLIEEMDVKDSGNFGWEDREAWFLVELHRQFVAERK